MSSDVATAGDNNVPHVLVADQRYLLAADLHLAAEFPSRISAFCAMMAQAPQCADAVYLLGDLFDAWAGDDENGDWAVQVREAISSTVAQGLPIYIQHGNRDFLLGRRFCQMTGCELLPDFCALSLPDAERILLTHGDLLCDDDNYLRYRRRVRGRLFRAFAAVLPLSLRRHLASKMRAGSQRQRQVAVVSPLRAAAAMQKWRCVVLVHGHTHNAGVEEWREENSVFHRRCLPDWENAFGYVLLSADGAMTTHVVTDSDMPSKKGQ